MRSEGRASPWPLSLSRLQSSSATPRSLFECALSRRLLQSAVDWIESVFSAGLVGWAHLSSGGLAQVLHRMLTPLPSPESVALHPVRILTEQVSKRRLTLRFRVKQVERNFNVDAFVELYLISRSAALAGFPLGSLQPIVRGVVCCLGD